MPISFFQVLIFRKLQNERKHDDQMQIGALYLMKMDNERHNEN